MCGEWGSESGQEGGWLEVGHVVSSSPSVFVFLVDSSCKQTILEQYQEATPQK